MDRLLLSLLLILLLSSGCSERPSGSLTVSVIGGEARAGNPNRQALDAPAEVMTGALMQGLVQFDAQGEIEPALAERWIVTDDGRSYIFRIRKATWSDGSPVTAAQVAQSLRTSLSPSSRNLLRPLMVSVREILPMTDSVIEMRLSEPQAGLLPLLADPNMAIIHKGRGTGPYRLYRSFPSAKLLQPVQLPGAPDLNEAALKQSERRVRGENAARAVARFSVGNASLVLGGRFQHYPLALAAAPASGALRIDPVNGLFGLLPIRSKGLAADREIRQALAMAIDRQAIVQQFGAQGWQISETLLPGRIDSNPQATPDWASLPFDVRLKTARERVARLPDDQRRVRISLPSGAGSRLLFAMLARDWQRIGITAERARPGTEPDFKLIDAVAPAGGATWYLARFRCGTAPLCSSAVGNSLAMAQRANAEDRSSFLSEADKNIAADQLYIPIARPLRWSLVAPRLTGFAENARAIHPLNRLSNTNATTRN